MKMKLSTKKTLVKVIAFCLMLVMVLSLAIPALAEEKGQWILENGKYKYRYGGTNMYAYSTWIKDLKADGTSDMWYVDANGYLVTSDWAKINGKWVTFDASGKLVEKTWVKRADGSWIWSAGDGRLTDNWETINGKDYHFNPDGIMETGWYFDGANYYYLSTSGDKVYGWVKDGNSWYYMDPSNSGKMATGELTVNGKRYLFDYVSGAMRTDN